MGRGVLLGVIAGISVLVIATSLWALSSSPQPSTIDRSILDLPAPSVSQCEQLGALIQREVNSGDASLLESTMDWNAIFARAAGDATLPEELLGWSLTSPIQPGQWGSQLLESMGTGGTYKLLQVRMVDEKPRLLFRVVAENGSPNYHEYEPVIHPNGTIRFNDVYIYDRGELLSETVRRDILPFMEWNDRGILGKIIIGKNDYVENSEKLVELRRLMAEGQPREVLTLYSTLPTAMQNDKNLLLSRYEVARRIGGSAYQRALSDVNARLASDPCLDLVLLAHRINERQFNEVNRSLRRINERVGGDPYLKVIRGNVARLHSNDVLGAKLLYREVIKAEPGMPYAYNALNQIALQERDYKETARLLSILEGKLGISVGDLTDVEVYQDFVRSGEYREWKRNRPAQPLGQVH